MRSRAKFLGSLAILLIGTLTLMAGCGPRTGVQRAERTTTSMEEVENQIQEMVTQIDATNASLQELMSPQEVGLREAFDQYTRNVSQMERLGQRWTDQTGEMKARGQQYFTEWEQQGRTYTNPQVRELSEQRRNELRRTFNQISESYIGVRGALETYLADLRDIRTYLSNDLTPQGVQNITPVAQRTIQDGERFKQEVQPAREAINRARTQMAPGGMQQ